MARYRGRATGGSAVAAVAAPFVRDIDACVRLVEQTLGWAVLAGSG